MLVPRPLVVIYVADEAQFVELCPDGPRALDALCQAGCLSDLRTAIESSVEQDSLALERLEGFVGELHRLGALSTE